MELTLNKYKEMRVKREENQTFERENLYVERQGRKTNGCVPFFTEFFFPITQKTRQKFHERTENREENNFLLLSNFKTMDYYLFFLMKVYCGE
jgi:hypothetical protein